MSQPTSIALSGTWKRVGCIVGVELNRNRNLFLHGFNQVVCNTRFYQTGHILNTNAVRTFLFQLLCRLQTFLWSEPD